MISARRILVDCLMEFKGHLRSKVALFWTLIFPLVLFVLFSAIFGSSGTIRIDLYVQDNDGSRVSEGFVDALDRTNAFNMKSLASGINATEEIRSRGITSLLVIPSGCGDSVLAGRSCNLTLMLDPSNPERAGIVKGVLYAVASDYNLQLANGTRLVLVQSQETVQTLHPVKPSDFYLSGIISMTIVTSSAFSIVSTVASSRDSGLLRKLASTPMKRSEWLLGKLLYLCVVNLLTALILMVIAAWGFGANVHPHPLIPVLILAGTVTYAGMGLVIIRVVRSSEGSIALVNGIVFPMMFLSGVFFPVDFMPNFMQNVARALPLTYLNDALRQVTVYGEINIAMVNLAAVGVLTLVFLALGVAFSSWSEDYITAPTT